MVPAGTPRCTGQTGIRGARNPDGIPDDYMSLLNPGASLVSPLVVRLHPWTRTKTQNWNMVYVPYCTGDIYLVTRWRSTKTHRTRSRRWCQRPAQHPRGGRLAEEQPQRPAQLLTTGCSAGGAGSPTNCDGHPPGHSAEPWLPARLSGPVFSAPPGSDIGQYPSLPLQNHIRSTWGLDAGPVPYLEPSAGRWQ